MDNVEIAIAGTNWLFESGSLFGHLILINPSIFPKGPPGLNYAKDQDTSWLLPLIYLSKPLFRSAISKQRPFLPYLLIF